MLVMLLVQDLQENQQPTLFYGLWAMISPMYQTNVVEVFVSAEKSPLFSLIQWKTLVLYQ